jgi:VWFA-related protein
VLVLALAAAGCAVVRAQTPVFRSGTDAVRVDVLVTDARGAPLPGLAPRDFVLRDSGVVQPIVSTSFEELPLHVVLALDTSGSVEGERFERLVGAARGLLDDLRPADAATLVVFSHVVTMRPLGQGRADEAERTLRSLTAEGWTAAFDATWTALMSADRPGFRPLVVLLSDGFDNRSWLGLDDVLETAKRVEAVVYCVRVRPDVPRVSERVAWQRRRGFAATIPAGSKNFLERVAEESGGRVMLADTDADLRPSLLRILEEFRRRYVLTYVPEGVDLSGWHAIDVTVRGRPARVTARRGYQRDWPGEQ